MTSSYSFLHARVNEKLAFLKLSTLESVFEKMLFHRSLNSKKNLRSRLPGRLLNEISTKLLLIKSKHEVVRKEINKLNESIITICVSIK